MKMIPFKFSIFIAVLLLFTSCSSLLSPTGTKEFVGTVKTCLTDSTAFINASSIIIIDDQNVNSNCANKPNYKSEEMDKVWPMRVFFSFKDKEYWYIFDSRPKVSNDSSTDIVFKSDDGNLKIAFRSHDGNLKISRKKKFITLTSMNFKWSRTYSYSYDKKLKIFTLQKLKT